MQHAAACSETDADLSCEVLIELRYDRHEEGTGGWYGALPRCLQPA